MNTLSPAPEPYRQSPDYQKRLNDLSRMIHEENNFHEALPRIESELLQLLSAERLTIYQRGRHDREIVSRYTTGREVREYRLALDPTSIASFVALTHQPLRIDNVYDPACLNRIHPKLRFNAGFDRDSGFRTRSMIVVPIKSRDTLLGVLQIINKKGAERFSERDLQIARDLSGIIGQKFHYDLRATHGPFDYLLHTKRITVRRLAELALQAEKDKKSVASLLVQDEKLLVEEVGESLERYYQVPFFRYDPEVRVPAELLAQLKLPYLRKSLWVPVACDRDKVVILIDNPNDTGRIMEIQQLLGARTYEFLVGIPEDILRYLGVGVAANFAPGDPGRHLQMLAERLVHETGADESSAAGRQPAAAGEDEPLVIQLVDRLIAHAHRLNASDIHIEPGGGSCAAAAVRMRVDGICRTAVNIPQRHIRAVIARIKIMANLDIAERRKPQDGKIIVRRSGTTLELRVATIPTVWGESAVMRLLSSGTVLPLNKVNLSARNAHVLQGMIARPHGILLVVGPTGSGKTTTLHAVLGHINTAERKIWTAEDPVEITQPGLQQIQVHPKIGFDFAAAMRAFLRADPDVILIGEMRDRETARIAVEASLTGHLVLSTLHTNSAPETITRLLDLGLDPLNFADALLGILAQRLVRTLCADCRQPYTPAEAEFNQLKSTYGEDVFPELGIIRQDTTLFKPAGCKRCGSTGYRGRTGIHELLAATPDIKKLIVHKSDVARIRDCASEQGMRTLMQDGIAKILQGQTDLLQLRTVTL